MFRILNYFFIYVLRRIRRLKLASHFFLCRACENEAIRRRFNTIFVYTSHGCRESSQTHMLLWQAGLLFMFILLPYHFLLN